MVRVLLLCVFATAAVAANARRPQVDTAAMREAIDSGRNDAPSASAASYAHFLLARMRHYEGNHRGAHDELMLALATDPQNPYLSTMAAEQLARLSEYERAEAALTRVLETHPTYHPALVLLGRVLYDEKKASRAKPFLSRAIKVNPGDIDAYLVLTQIHLDEHEFGRAVAIVEAMGEALPGEPVGFKRLGMALAERGEWPKARAMLLEASRRDAGDAEVWTALASVYEAEDEHDLAQDAYDQAIVADSDQIDVYLAAGRLALRRNEPVKAKAYFDGARGVSKEAEIAVKIAFSYLAARKLNLAAEVLDVARVENTEVRLHFYSGLVHERLREWKKAADAFSLVPKDSGDLALEARVHQASCLSMAREHAAALAVLQAQVAAHPDDVALLAQLSRVLERAGRLKEAELTLARTLQSHATPDSFEAMAGFYERQGRGRDAIALLKKALKASPNDESLLFTLGALYERSGDITASMNNMRQVLALNPDNANAMNFIGYTLADRGLDYDEAERLVKRALEFKPESGAFLDSMGWVYFRRGEYELAVQYLERATTLAPGEVTIDEHLGDAYSRVARTLDAERAYRRALESLKSSGDASSALAQRGSLERKLKKFGRATADR